MTRAVPAAPAAERSSHRLPAGELHLAVTRSELPADALFLLAARNNPRRAFLFLSRVLAKHLPVSPAVIVDCHERIARHVPGCGGPVLFIGMAETATGLGQGVFEAWQRQNPGVPSLYVQTSRYRALGAEVLGFEESHSHAPQVFLHLPVEPAMRALFFGARALVLVDDEISTGNTFVNLARTCLEQAPGIAHVHLASITDFLGEARGGLQPRIGRPLTFGSLLEGTWSFTPAEGAAMPEGSAAQAAQGREPLLADGGFGRLGRTTPLEIPADLLASLARSVKPGQRVLVLGTGEFMHGAFALGRALEQATAATVKVHATTRSPILPWGPISHAERFEDNYGEGIANYLYNFDRAQHDQVFLCHETAPTDALRQTAARLDARLIHFISDGRLAESALR